MSEEMSAYGSTSITIFFWPSTWKSFSLCDWATSAPYVNFVNMVREVNKIILTAIFKAEASFPRDIIKKVTCSLI